jgi:hypothetical protein
MNGSSRPIGFDRRIRLHWLDATALHATENMSPSAVRRRLEEVLGTEIRGEKSRKLAKTVLLHTWVLVPKSLVGLRDEALAFLRDATGDERLTLHWGMCSATYPFFRHTAATIGRLLQLQGRAGLSQVTRRVAEAWGERSTVTRAVRRLVRTLVDWEVLAQASERGVFELTRRRQLSPRLSSWLLEASLFATGSKIASLQDLAGSAANFPFQLQLSPGELGRRERLEVFQQGLDCEMVVLKG